MGWQVVSKRKTPPAFYVWWLRQGCQASVVTSNSQQVGDCVFARLAGSPRSPSLSGYRGRAHLRPHPRRRPHLSIGQPARGEGLPTRARCTAIAAALFTLIACAFEVHMHNENTHTQTETYTHICIHICICIYMNMHIFAYVHTCMHVHMHTRVIVQHKHGIFHTTVHQSRTDTLYLL